MAGLSAPLVACRRTGPFLVERARSAAARLRHAINECERDRERGSAWIRVDPLRHSATPGHPLPSTASREERRGADAVWMVPASKQSRS